VTKAEDGSSSIGTFYERIVLTDGTMVQLTGDDGLNGLEGDTPKYEVYGGLTAKDSASFIYESTAFWHWKEDDQPDICWSDSAQYRTAYKTWTERTAVGVFLDKLEGTTPFETFEDLVTAIEAQVALNCQTTTCKDAYEQYETLYNEGMLIFQVPGGLGGEDEGVVEYQNGSLTGDPVIIEGGVAEGGLTSGPNFESGRRTWIDILSE
jgi:hypothetical protein